MSVLSDDIHRVVVNTSTAGDNTIIADPGDGKWLAIDFITLNPSGGAQTVTLKNIRNDADADLPLVLDDNQPITFENVISQDRGVLDVKHSSALVINLSAATQVTGFANYRIINN